MTKAWLLSSPKTTIVLLNEDQFEKMVKAVCVIDDCDEDDITITQLVDIYLNFHPDSVVTKESIQKHLDAPMQDFLLDKERNEGIDRSGN